MNTLIKKLQITTAAALCVATLGIATMGPAKADGAASTRNIILGIGALAAGIAIESNVARKNTAANTVTGQTSDGSTVFNDGHVVTPDGQSYYPGNDGQSIACNDGSCSITGGNGAAPSPYSSYSYYSSGFRR